MIVVPPFDKVILPTVYPFTMHLSMPQAPHNKYPYNNPHATPHTITPHKKTTP